MKKLPSELRIKLKKLHILNSQAHDLTQEISKIIDSYGVDQDYLTAMKTDDMSTEALTFIYYGEGTSEENIEEIEKVFLYYVNKK